MEGRGGGPEADREGRVRRTDGWQKMGASEIPDQRREDRQPQRRTHRQRWARRREVGSEVTYHAQAGGHGEIPDLTDPNRPQRPYLRESLHLLALQPLAAESRAQCSRPGAGQPSFCSFRLDDPHRPGASGSLGLGALLRPQFSNTQSRRSIGNAWGCTSRFAPLAWSPALPGGQCPQLRVSGVPRPGKGCQLLHGSAKGPQDPGGGTSPSQVEGLVRVTPGQTLSSLSSWLHRSSIQG